MIPNSPTGALSGLMNLVPTPGKLTILPLRELDPIPMPSGPPYIAMFNPDQYSIEERSNYHDKCAPGSSSGEQNFNRVEPREFTFEFLVDGTGASGEQREVVAEILLFKIVTGFSGDLHRPNYLLLAWGTFIATAVLTRMNVKYTLFRDNGTPLRATISATFREHTPRITALLKMNLFSSDLTHRRMAVEGDTLPNLSQMIYRSTRFYLEVARANDMTSFRRLKPGTELYFPPLQK